MEQARLLIAIVLSALIFLLWQLFFVDKDANQQSAKKTEQPPVEVEQVKEAKPYPKEQEVAATDQTTVSGTEVSAPTRIPRTITVDTPFYQVRLSEKGGGFSSFILKKLQGKSCQRFSLARAYSPERFNRNRFAWICREKPARAGQRRFFGKPECRHGRHTGCRAGDYVCMEIRRWRGGGKNL